MSYIHGRHHNADASGTLTFQAVDHREEITVQPALFAIFENGVCIIDKNNRWSVIFCCLKNLVDFVIELVGPGNEGAVNQEKLAFEAMGQRPPHRRLARSRRST